MRGLGAGFSPLVFSIVAAFSGGRLSAGEPPAITRGPYLQALLSSSVRVLWLTDAPSRGRIEYQPPAGPPAVEYESTDSFDHVLTLSGLSPGTVYRYRVLEGDRPLSEEFSFRTAPQTGQGEVRAVVTGDSGSGRAEQYEVAALMEELKPDLFLHTGDLDYLHDPDASIFLPYRRLLASTGFYPCRGNHDLPLDWGSLFVPAVEIPDGTGTYYSFDWGSAHFVLIDTSIGLTAGDNQLTWLAADLERARAVGRPWIVLLFHEPVFTVGWYSGKTWARDLILPIADRFGVDLLLNGHDHNYQRSHPVRDGVVHDAWQDPSFVSPGGAICLVTGGGGQGLYPELPESDHRFTRLFRDEYHAVELVITLERLTARALSPGKEVLDEFSITRGPRPEPRFIRGDVDPNGSIEVTDAVVILNHLFFGQALECPFTADTNGSGRPPGITDPIVLLNYLFLGDAPPAPPFPGCGEDPNADDSWCVRTGCPR